MIAYIIIGFVAVGAVFLVASLLVVRWEHRQLKKNEPHVDDRLVPLRDYAGPYVPPSWRPTDEDLRDPTPHPGDSTPPDPAP